MAAEARDAVLWERMWLSLATGGRRRLRLLEEQSIWPAPDGSDAEFVVRTDAVVDERIVLATPRICRVRYQVGSLAATLTLGDQPPAPWPDASRVDGHSFELMVTDKGPLVVPAEGPRLANRHASWLERIAECMRSCWPVPPDDCRPGRVWESIPTLPGGLPPHTRSAKIKLRFEVLDVLRDSAEIEVKFGLNAVIHPPRTPTPQRAEGRGQLMITLSRKDGVTRATRKGVMEIVRPSAARNQVVRSQMTMIAG